MKKCVFTDPHYLAVMFQMEWEGKVIEVMGFIYFFLLEEFNKEETLPSKRLMLCNVAINNTTGKLIKNCYEGRHS